MKNLLKASTVITLLLLLCTLDDFLSLHDIKADYVSKSVFPHLGIPLPARLPSGTDTPLEWTSIMTYSLLRSVLTIANLGVLVLLATRLRLAKKPSTDEARA